MLGLSLLVPAGLGLEVQPAALVLAFQLSAILVLVWVPVLGVLALLLLLLATVVRARPSLPSPLPPPPLLEDPPPLSVLLTAFLPLLGIAPITEVLVAASPRLPSPLVPLVPPARPGVVLSGVLQPVGFRLVFSHLFLLPLVLLLPTLLGAARSILLAPHPTPPLPSVLQPPLRVRWLAVLPPLPLRRHLHLRARQLEWGGWELVERLRVLAHPKLRPPLARAPPAREEEEGALEGLLLELKRKSRRLAAVVQAGWRDNRTPTWRSCCGAWVTCACSSGSLSRKSTCVRSHSWTTTTSRSSR